LNPRTDHILEVAIVVTDDNGLETHSMECLVRPVGLSYDQLVAMLPKRVLEMHSKSGLLLDLRQGWDGQPGLPPALRRYEAEEVLTHFICKAALAHVKCTPDGNTPINPNPLRCTPLAGNTVSFDRNFLREHMPAFEQLFSYRSLDVTALNEIALRIFPNIHMIRPQGDKGVVHRAMADIRNSLAQFHHYAAHMFVSTDLELIPVTQ
jgi:oligoribonuclease (3'-5' exoribonuclease)